MDETRLIQIWVVATLSGVVGLGFLYVRRIEASRSSHLWAGAWLAFLLSLALNATGSGPATILAHTAGTTFPALLLAGAIAFTGRPTPRWLLPMALAIGTFCGVTRVVGLQLPADLAVFLFEAPLGFIAAGLLWQMVRAGRSTPAVAMLGALHATFSLLEIGNVLLVDGAGPSPVYFAFGGLATLVLASTQLLALLERARFLHAQDLELLREIAQSGTLAATPSEVARQALAAIRARLDIDGAAIWLLRTDTQRLECIEYFGASVTPPDEVLMFGKADRPLPRRAMRSGDSIFLADVVGDPDLPIHPWFAEQGFRSGGVLPLRKRDESCGIIVVGRKRVDPFEPPEQRILAIAADELYLSFEHVQAVQRLTAERRVLASVIDTSPTGILISDRAGLVETLNGTFTQHLGERDPEDWIGKRIDSLVSGIAVRFADPEEFAHAFRPISPEASAVTTPVTLSRPEVRDLLIFTSPILSLQGDLLGRVWVTRDVSEERRLQEELRQSQKMETLGTLAGGVAHDFNNQLAAILGNARLLLAEASDEETRESLSDIQSAAEHCADLTRSLLAFARRSPLSRSMLQAEWVIDQAAALLRSMLPSTIHFEIRADSALPAVSADATQLQQMLINLVINARDAVGATGCIRVSAAAREVAVPGIEGSAPGTYVEFAVSDDGSGMAAETRRRAFDPFFTTKDVSQGTGLGLAVVYGAARAHEGWVEVESAPGEGSTFRVLIPAARDLEEMPEPSAPSERARQGSETILLADDEPKVRRLVARVLSDCGYDVVEASDGRQAVESMARNGAAIQLVLLDVTMPALDGIAALERIRADHPDLPAILMSGLQEVDEALLDAPHTTFLPKPYDLDQVTETIRRMLDARCGERGDAG